MCLTNVTHTPYNKRTLRWKVLCLNPDGTLSSPNTRSYIWKPGVQMVAEDVTKTRLDTEVSKQSHLDVGFHVFVTRKDVRVQREYIQHHVGSDQKAVIVAVEVEDFVAAGRMNFGPRAEVWKKVFIRGSKAPVVEPSIGKLHRKPKKRTKI